MLGAHAGYRIADAFARLVKHIKWTLPKGRLLPDDVWQTRHQGILALLWLHAIGVVGFGVMAGFEWDHSLLEGAVLAGIAIVAGWKKGDRKFQSSTASLGLITASAVLVHLSGGYIEMHFHFFVMLAVIVLYQDWIPFLLAIGYVVIHHGLIGVLDPGSVYNHPDAFAHPWKWAAIHGAFVLAASVASIVSWRLNEVLRAHNELILNSTDDGIIGLDLQGNITFVNPAAARMSGYEVEELKSRPVHDLLRPSKADGLSNPENEYQIHTLIQEGTVQPVIEGVFWRKDGTNFLAEYIGTPIREGGIVVGAVVTFNDITERKQAQAALQKAKDELEIKVAERTAELEDANERLRLELAERQRAEATLAKRAAELEESRNFLDSIIENIPTILFIKDAEDLTFVRVNRAAAELNGVGWKEMIGKNDYDYVPKQEADFYTAKDRMVLAEGKLMDIPEESIHTPHKGVRLLHTRKVPIVGADGKPKYLLGISEDITERKQAEAALALARDQALEANRLKSELLAKVSHELRTPLSAILGFAEMLGIDGYGSLSDRQRWMTTGIIDSTHYLTHLVNELLDQAQLEAGKLRLNIQLFALADLVDDTLTKMNVLAQAKGLSLTSDIAADVPATLYGDAARLQQILVNLVSNAIKFTAAGAVRVRLYCPNADHWVVQVSDTGCGIPAEAQAYIFEPFWQVDGSMTRAHAGTGLGLSIVKQLTTLMGGEITLESEVERGSTFTVSLPLQAIKEKII